MNLWDEMRGMIRGSPTLSWDLRKCRIVPSRWAVLALYEYCCDGKRDVAVGLELIIGWNGVE